MIWRGLNVVMALLFLFAVAVQHNDPDPIAWMAIYGAAAASCIASVVRRLRAWLPAIVGAVALVWTLWLAPQAIGKTSWGAMTAAYEMSGDPAAEVGREMGGLMIVAAWMGLQLLVRWWTARAASPTPPGSSTLSSEQPRSPG